MFRGVLRKTAWLCIQLTVVQALAGSAQLFAGSAPESRSILLLQDMKTLQAGIDSGKVQPSDAIEAFAAALQQQNLSFEDVNAFVKTQLTPKQFQVFQEKVDSALRGINPDTLTPEEVGDLVGQALAQMHTEGLYWNGCALIWTGVAVIAAALVTGIVAAVKSRSVQSIQNSYAKKIADSNTYYNESIVNTQNWKTAYPAAINADQTDIQVSQNQMNWLEWQLAYGNLSDTQRSDYLLQLTTYQNRINSDIIDMNNYQAKMLEYQADPSRVAWDISNLAQERDSAQVDLQSKQVAAIAAAPANQVLGKQLGIGAGIGGAIGIGVMTTGLVHGCQY